MTKSAVRALIGAVIIGAVMGAAPSASAETITFTASLLPANETPSVTNADQSGTGLAIVTLNVTRDSGNNIMSAVAAFDLGLSRFSAGESVILAHIHQGAAAGVNGPVVVDSGVSPSNPLPLGSGGGIFVPPGTTVSPSIASQIIANPEGYYFNVHTSLSPDGAARGQLSTSDGVGFKIFASKQTFFQGDLFAVELFLGNTDGTTFLDAFAGIGLAPQIGPTSCPGSGNRRLVFLGANNTFAQECLFNLASPGSHAIPLAANVGIPSLALNQFTLLSANVPPGTPPGPYFVFFCRDAPNQFPGGQPICDISPFDVQ